MALLLMNSETEFRNLEIFNQGDGRGLVGRRRARGDRAGKSRGNNENQFRDDEPIGDRNNGNAGRLRRHG
jgi:hypothetical protein